MQEDIQKSKQMVHEIIMKTHHPEQWEAEQAKKAQDLKELLAFVEGALASLEQQEVKKGAVLFKSDKSSPCGFSKG